MFLILEGFQDIFEADLRWWRGLLIGSASQGFDLFEVLIKLMVGFIDISLFDGLMSSKFFL